VKFPSVRTLTEDTEPGTPPTTPVRSPAAASDDDDKPWKPQLKFNYGYGVTKPLWAGRTPSGGSAPGSAYLAEVDQKVEFDVEVPTSVAIGAGHLTLSLGAEYDVPLDRAHRGKPTVTGTFELSADDAIRLGKRATLSPFVDLSLQDQKGLMSGVAKGGLELKIDLWKYGALKADANVGVQKGFRGMDAQRDPRVVIPFEGNAKLEIKLP
jgi:hypothetical protein